MYKRIFFSYIRKRNLFIWQVINILAFNLYINWKLLLGTHSYLKLHATKDCNMKAEVNRKNFSHLDAKENSIISHSARRVYVQILLSRFCGVYDIVKREYREALWWARKMRKLHFYRIWMWPFALESRGKSINADKIWFQPGCSI